MSTEYSEDRLVQQTTAEYFDESLGWESIYAFNTETFGAASTLGRSNKTEVVLTRYLKAALQQLNPDHPQQAYDLAIEQLTSYSSAKTTLQINQDKYKLIRDGVRVSYPDAQGITQEPLLQVIDFDNPDNNDFRIVRELWIEGETYSSRPDIIGFINGLPLLFIELKKSTRDIQVAYEDNLTKYKQTIPELFHYNALVLLSNGIRAKVGTATSPYRFFLDWKRLQEEERGRVDLETMLMGIGQKQNFLDLVENFIFYDDSGGETIKILARNHQFLGVNRAFQAVQNRDSRKGKLGVFWHTQGSGKSYSMGFLSEKVHRKLTGSFTFLIVTDRTELDDQIVQTFAGIQAVRDDATQASSGSHLVKLLKENHRYVFTLVHKFNQDGVIYSERDDIIVMCDEAHRTQYGKLAENMRLGLPNASFIAFTGTPLMASAEDQKTREVFGDYVSTYNFQRAIEDGATVPLYYDNRGEKLYFDKDGQRVPVANEDELNSQIASELAKHDLDEASEAQVLRRLKREYIVLTAEKRLDRIAQDLVAHYTTRWQTGKAMLVCLDKVTVIRMLQLIDKYWKDAIAQQEIRVQQATDEQDHIEQTKHLKWLQETEYLPVISESADELKTFKSWDIDIQPYRQSMKSRDLESDFKNPDHPFRLVIVCAMWLTGFDVPTLATLYTDKPMSGHTLMQTITRANRTAEGKNNGLLVDYNGILKSLRAALAKYAQLDPPEDGETPKPDSPDDALYSQLEQLQKDYATSIQTCIEHLANLGFDLQDLIDAQGFDKLALLDEENTASAVNAVCANDESRARFDVLTRDIFKKKLALVSYPELTQPYRSQHNAIEAIYKHLHKTQELSDDLNAVLRSLHGVISDAINVETEREAGEDSGRLYNIADIDWDLLQDEFAKSDERNTQVQTIKEATERQIKRMVNRNQTPQRLDLYSRYQKILEEYNRETDRATIEQTFEELMNLVQDLSEEDSRAVREGLNEEYLAVFDLICQQKNDLSPQTRERIKRIAQNLIDAVKTELQKLDSWTEKGQTKAQVKTFIYDYLYDEATGLPVDDYEEEDVEVIANVVYLHVLRQYKTPDHTPYKEAA